MEEKGMSLETAFKLIALHEPMATVCSFLLKGNFTDPETPVKEGEVVIGALNRFEKALYSAKGKIAASQKERIEREREAFKEHDHSLCISNRESYEALEKLLWANIESRLRETGCNIQNIGLRKGYEIVSLPQADADNAVGVTVLELTPESLMEFLGGLKK